MSKSKFVSKSVNIIQIAFPSFIPKSNISTKEIDELEESIRLNGILQPIGICKNDDNESKEYKYLIIWGRKRLLAASNLGIKKIPAIIFDAKPSREVFLKLSKFEPETKLPMKRADIWLAIRKLYLEYGNEKIVSEKTGIPLPVVKDVVFERIVDTILGGPELIDYCKNECHLTNKVSKDIFYLLIDNENHSVDLKKGKKLADVLAVQDLQTQNRVLKVAIANPKGDIDGWVAEAKSFKKYKKKLEGVLDIELIEEEDYGLLKMAEAYGLTVNELINKIVKDKLTQEGFLKEV